MHRFLGILDFHYISYGSALPSKTDFSLVLSGLFVKIPLKIWKVLWAAAINSRTIVSLVSDGSVTGQNIENGELRCR